MKIYVIFCCSVFLCFSLFHMWKFYLQNVKLWTNLIRDMDSTQNLLMMFWLYLYADGNGDWSISSDAWQLVHFRHLWIITLESWKIELWYTKFNRITNWQMENGNIWLAEFQLLGRWSCQWHDETSWYQKKSETFQ